MPMPLPLPSTSRSTGEHPLDAVTVVALAGHSHSSLISWVYDVATGKLKDLKVSQGFKGKL